MHVCMELDLHSHNNIIVHGIILKTSNWHFLMYDQCSLVPRPSCPGICRLQYYGQCVRTVILYSSSICVCMYVHHLAQSLDLTNA